jgi:hypothetical protein
MKRAIEILHAPSDGYAPFSLEIHEPGLLRTVLTGYQPPSSIIPASMGKAPVAEMKAVPALVFEIDPEAATRVRSFVWLPAGRALSFEGVLVFCSIYVDEGTGMPLMLYESIPTAP